MTKPEMEKAIREFREWIVNREEELREMEERIRLRGVTDDSYNLHCDLADEVVRVRENFDMILGDIV